MFEVGDRVYIKKERLTGKIINVSDYRPLDAKYVVDLDGNWADYYFCGEDDLREECLCPLGGDESNDCQGCVYSDGYHFEHGECKRRAKR